MRTNLNRFLSLTLVFVIVAFPAVYASDFFLNEDPEKKNETSIQHQTDSDEEVFSKDLAPGKEPQVSKPNIALADPSILLPFLNRDVEEDLVMGALVEIADYGRQVQKTDTLQAGYASQMVLRRYLELGLRAIKKGDLSAKSVKDGCWVSLEEVFDGSMAARLYENRFGETDLFPELDGFEKVLELHKHFWSQAENPRFNAMAVKDYDDLDPFSYFYETVANYLFYVSVVLADKMEEKGASLPVEEQVFLKAFERWMTEPEENYFEAERVYDDFDGLITMPRIFGLER